MGERDALLRAVCEAPDDDAPRLVFADWLDEHGEPDRAEFIRLQIAYANQFEVGSADESDPAWRRASELEERHGAGWAAGRPEDRFGATFRMWRGFPF